jgi:hypothetical protein
MTVQNSDNYSINWATFTEVVIDLPILGILLTTDVFVVIATPRSPRQRGLKKILVVMKTKKHLIYILYKKYGK